MRPPAEKPTPIMTTSGQYFFGSLDRAKIGVTTAGGENANSGDRRKDNHAFAYRASSSLFGKRFYFSIFFGKEKRSDARLEADGRKKPFWVLMVMAFTIAWIIFWLTIVSLGLGVVVVYLLKSGVGIDLFEQNSFLHDYFFD